MLPLIIGIAAGAAAMRLVQKKLPTQPLHKASQTLRETGVAGLSAIERSSAKLRSRLENEAESLTGAHSSAGEHRE